jgi:hypothetical protein
MRQALDSFGRASLRNPIRFPQISIPASVAVPVTLPPGRAMFDTSLKQPDLSN